MKNQFVIFVFVLLYLLAISMAGCSEGSSDLMEQLTGEYTLVELKMDIDRTTLSVEPPEVFGELVLETGGRYFSLTVVITDEVGLVGDNETTSYDSWKVNGDSWEVDETTLSIREHNRTEYNSFKYVWDETHLTFDSSDEDVTLTMKWRKL